MIEPEMDLPIVSLDELTDLRRRGKLPPPWHYPDSYRRGVKTVHGPAVAEWRNLGFEMPRFARRVAFEAERRIDVEICIAGPRRQAASSMHWIYGHLDIQPNDIRFTDLPKQPVLSPVDADEDGVLVYDLSHNAAFAAAVQDDIVAGTAFILLTSFNFICRADPLKHAVATHGAVSHMLALVRGRGENYLDVEFELQDFAMHLPPDDNSVERAKEVIMAIVTSIGWENPASSQMR